MWATARASAVDPEATFGTLRDGPLARAVGFALLVEAVALGSIALFVGLLGWLIAPEFVRALIDHTLSSRTLSWLAVVAVPGLAAAMVVLHALWGLAIELGIRSSGNLWRLSRGLRFACYSCGWDLLTSPAGLALGVATGGLRRTCKESWLATQVPRRAMQAYLERCRALAPGEQSHSRRVALSLLGAVIVLGTLALSWAVLSAVVAYV
jgi:hypothetical protein